MLGVSIITALSGDRALCPQVSHHIHCNDEALDEDVFSAFPALRFDSRLPIRPWHKFQHIYMVRTCTSWSGAAAFARLLSPT